MNEAAEGMNGVMGVTARKLVSIDFNHDPHSAIVALGPDVGTGRHADTRAGLVRQ